MDLGSVKRQRVTVRVDLVTGQRLEAANPCADGAAEAVAAQVFLHDRGAGEEVLLRGRGDGAAHVYPVVDGVGGGLQYREPGAEPRTALPGGRGVRRSELTII